MANIRNIFKGLFFVLCISCTPKPISKGTFTDNRDGRVYNWVQIKNQVWMAQNLNFVSPNSRYAYSDSISKDLFGRLYKIDVAKSACPVGWHLPSDEEWKELEMATGMRSSNNFDPEFSLRDASKLLKGGSTGFEVSLGQNSNYNNLSAEYWTSSYDGIPIITRYFLWKDYQGVLRENELGSAHYCFVRCIKNQNEAKSNPKTDDKNLYSPSLLSTFIDTRDGKVYKTVTLDKQTWMAENLNYQTPNSKYNRNDSINKSSFGRLYKIDAALQACPSGWHLPTDADWDSLESTITTLNIRPNKYGSWGASASPYLVGGATGFDIKLDTFPSYFKDEIDIQAQFWTSSHDGIPIITRLIKAEYSNIRHSKIGAAHSCYVRCKKD